MTQRRFVIKVAHSHSPICFTVNADDRESNMVFKSKSNEVEDEDEDEIPEKLAERTDSDSSDGASASKANKNFFAAVNWQDKDERTEIRDSFDDSDDDFGNLRNGEQIAAGKSASQAHDFFSEREGQGTSTQDDVDLFNLRSPPGDELDEHLFNLEDSDSDTDEPIISKQTANVDLLNLESNSYGGSSLERPSVTKPDPHVTVVDDMGVDLLNLSPGKLASPPRSNVWVCVTLH